MEGYLTGCGEPFATEEVEEMIAAGLIGQTAELDYKSFVKNMVPLWNLKLKSKSLQQKKEWFEFLNDLDVSLGIILNFFYMLQPNKCSKYMSLNIPFLLKHKQHFRDLGETD